MSDLLFQVAGRLGGLLRNERYGSFAGLTAREFREYGLRCCPLGSTENRRVYDLHLLGS